MVFALHMSEIAEIGGAYVFFHKAPQMLSQLVTQRIQLYVEAGAALEGNLRLFSFTSRVFHVLVLYGSVPFRVHLMSE